MGLSPQLGFWGYGFESTTWFLDDVGLSLQLCFLGGCGFESTSFFLGGGDFFLNFAWFGWWWFYFDFLGFFFFGFFLWWNFINICSTFTHSFTQFCCVLWRNVSVGRCGFGAMKQ